MVKRKTAAPGASAKDDVCSAEIGRAREVPIAANDDGLAELLATPASRRDAQGRFLPRGGVKRAGGVKRGAARARKPKRWSARAEKAFLEALAETGNVAHSARVAGFSDTSVYRRRQVSDDFREAWAVALREGFARLETEMLQRALNGVEKPIYHGGKKVGATREYNDAHALRLLSLHRASVHGSARGDDATARDVPIDQLRLLVSDRLAEINRRLGGEG